MTQGKGTSAPFNRRLRGVVTGNFTTWHENRASTARLIHPQGGLHLVPELVAKELYGLLGEQLDQRLDPLGNTLWPVA